MKRSLPTSPTGLNFTAPIAAGCAQGAVLAWQRRLRGWLCPLSAHGGLLAPGSGTFRRIALCIWGKKEQRKFARKHSRSCRREQQKHSSDKDKKPNQAPTTTEPQTNESPSKLKRSTKGKAMCGFTPQTVSRKNMY